MISTKSSWIMDN